VVIVGLGANLASQQHGPPRASLTRALDRFIELGLIVISRSRWYMSAPQPPAPRQPNYVNGVVVVETGLDPATLLALLHRIEAEFGRVRSTANAARVLDLDLLAYGDLVLPEGGPGRPILPHPRLAERAFVLRPLAEVAPHWRHPVTGLDLSAMLAALGADQVAEPMPD
jgi:2-amino-4-hydroxy-6-hydroxymethyldihydropteridine diphosphokinase